jgi:alpha-L-rhamnosidase
MDIVHLKCEYAANPIGLDILTPQFSWQMRGGRRGARQSAYQLLVARSPEDLAAVKNLVWDTGKVAACQSAGVLYAGPALESRVRYHWKVRVWGAADAPSESAEPAFFEMGLLQPSDWQALWVGCPPSWSGCVLYFRRAFRAKGRIRKARAYVAGLGYYVLYLNGRRVGDHVLDPGTTDYNNRVLYATYDIAEYLGEHNALGVMIGPGWYGIPKLRMQVELTFEDGRAQVLATCWDPFENWLVSVGPTLHSSVFGGERYDARQERPSWAMPDGPIEPTTRADQWINVVVTDSPGGKMVSQLQEPIKVVETLTPKLIGRLPGGAYVLDAGRNLAGWAAIKLRGAAGTCVTLKFGESLKPDGSVNQENLRSATSEDVYILKGNGEEEWEPSFTYHGFRYVQVEGFPHEPKGNGIRVRVVRSAVAPTGTFRCSNDLLNRIHRMVQSTEASNLHSVPTDCPQRDERMGWLNDMTVRIEQALYNYDLARFYTKWVADVRDTQAADGSITDTAPFRWGFRPADPVSASYLLAVMKSYEFYGNIRLVSQHFDGLKAWVDYLASRTENGVVNYSYWGDWSPPEAFGTPGSVGSGAVSRNTPGKLMSTGYLYYCTRLIERMASVLGRRDEETVYRRLGDETARAFNAAWWDEATGGYGSNNQACNSFALFLGLVEKNNISRVVDNLAADVRRNDFHLTTGNLCTKYLLETLTEHGQAELAYQLATQETYPSWGYMLANGATTLWERWEHKTGGEMNSHNHPMMGSIGSWFYKYPAGILPDVRGPGFERFTVKPVIFENLDFVEAEVQSIKGLIRSAWKKESGTLSLQVTVPGNSTATVYVPARNNESVTESGRPVDHAEGCRLIRMEPQHAVIEIGSGDYQFQSDRWKDQA